jgi:flagellar hook-basal body complex protein FliE
MKAGNEGLDKPIPIGENDTKSNTSFADLVTDAINSVDQAQKTADHDVKNIVMGKTDNVAETMIAMEKAQLSFNLMLEIRNKAVSTYQELSRMSI